MNWSYVFDRQYGGFSWHLKNLPTSRSYHSLHLAFSHLDSLKLFVDLRVRLFVGQSVVASYTYQD